jgi:general secretion pathway protein D
MVRWKTLFVLSLVSASVAACSSLQKPFIEPPDMMGQLANANLDAVKPAHGPARADHPDGTEPAPFAEKFPGDDRVMAQRKKFDGVAQKSGSYELNFSDAELSELAKVILRDTLGITYVFDPRVQGRVTVSTGGPVTRSELLSILESVLAMNQGVLVVEGNVYRIVPEGEGRQASVSIFNYVKEAKEVGPGYGVSIFALKYVSSETMTRMLESLAAKQEGLRASVYNNLLFIRGTSKEREGLVDIVSMFDVDWMKGQSAGIYTLKNAAPEDVLKELQQVFQADSQGKGLVKFQPIARLNAILVVTQKAKMLDEIEEWVSRLDRGGSEGDNFYVYRVENGRAKDLADLLMASFNGGGGGSRPPEEKEVAPTLAASRIGQPSSSFGSASSSSGSAGGEGPLHTDAAKKNEPSDTSASDTSSSLLQGSSSGSSESGVRVTPDERNNKLLIKASARDYRKILGILRRIDQPPLQVLINATLAEVTLNDNLAYGVQFYLQKNGGKDGLLGFTNGQGITIGPAAPGLNFIIGNIASNPRIILDALAKETSVRVVSSPSVVVLHNQPATLQVGDEVPFTTRQAQSVINPDAPIVNEIEYKNTGVILKVTPRINSNGLVTMEIEQEISAVSRTTTGATDNLTPTISQRRISSTIAVQSGQMVVLGGLISEQLDHEKSRIPVFGKIPYLGDVIGGSTGAGRSRTELVVFLQPSVIRDPEDASNVAQAVRASMQSLAPRAAAWDVEVEGSGGKPVK